MLPDFCVLTEDTVLEYISVHNALGLFGDAPLYTFTFYFIIIIIIIYSP